MARASRKAVFDALFKLTEGLTWENWDGKAQTIQTSSRKIKLFSDVPVEQQPWFGQAEHDEEPSQVSNLPYKRVWKAQWIFYINSKKNPKATLSVDISNLLDALDECIRPKPSDPGYPNRLTLGGLAHHVFSDGRTFKDPGDIDNQGMIVYPITILVP